MKMKRVVSYRKLFEILKLRGMTLNTLVTCDKKYRIGKGTAYRIYHRGDVRLSVLLKVCNFLDVDLKDIVDTELVRVEDEN